MTQPGLEDAPETSAPSSRPAPSHWRRVGRLSLRVFFLVTVLALAAVEIHDQYASVRAGLRDISPASLVAGLLALEAGLVLSMLSWREVLADLGSRLPLGAAARVFFVGQLGKYLPGSVWPVLAQMELGRDHQVPRQRTLTASLVAIGIGVLGALLIAGVLLPVAVHETRWRVALLGALAVCLVVASPPVLNRIVGVGLRVLRRKPLDRPLSTVGLLRALGLACASWATQGLAVYSLTVSLGGKSPHVLLISIGAYAAASAAGILVIVAPAGLGVREPVLVAALASEVSAGRALVVALVVRLLASIADLGTGTFWALLPRSRAARETSGSTRD